MSFRRSDVSVPRVSPVYEDHKLLTESGTNHNKQKSCTGSDSPPTMSDVMSRKSETQPPEQKRSLACSKGQLVLRVCCCGLQHRLPLNHWSIAWPMVLESLAETSIWNHSKCDHFSPCSYFQICNAFRGQQLPQSRQMDLVLGQEISCRPATLRRCE